MAEVITFCAKTFVLLCVNVPVYAQQFHLPLKSWLLLTETLISAFSALVLKDYPGESASQGDPSLLLEDSRGPEGKNTKTTVTFFFFLVRRLTD